MDASTSKRNEPVLSKSTKRNLRRKEQRRIKKAKLTGYTNQSIDGPTTPNSNDDQGVTPDSINNQDNQANDERLEIFYDSKKHKIQLETRLSAKNQSRQYIRSQWVSEDFLASDLKPINYSRTTTIVNMEFTFLEKLIIKKQQRRIVKLLLNRGLLSPSNVKSGTFTLNLDTLSNLDLENIADATRNELYKSNISGNSGPSKSLPPQTVQIIPTASEVPTKFLRLLQSEIFGKTKGESNIESGVKNSVYYDNHPNPANLQLWKEFASWACFSTSDNRFYKKFHDHCRRLWRKVLHAYQQHEAYKNNLELDVIPDTLQRHPKDKLFIAKETTEKVVDGIRLDGYKYVQEPQCFENAFGEMIIDFFDLADLSVAKSARIVVDWYYNHNLSHPSHQSKQFSNDLIEYFGGFTDSNNEPYTTINTASTHCREHQTCVQKLIKGLQPISNTINDYFDRTYPILYSKMKKLNLGPNVPRSFGAFPSISINFNTICQFHRDLKDHRNTLCVVCPLGIFEGGELTFPELKLAINAKQGQAIAFRSHLLVHGNLPIINGVRHSVVFYIHDTVIKQKRLFGSLFNDGDSDMPEILDNTQSVVDGLSIAGSVKKHDKKPPKYSLPRLAPRNSSKLKNHRRSYIDLEPARRGLPAQYKRS